MERISSGSIRKIQYGLIPQLPILIVQVGSKVNRDYVICDIIEDRSVFVDLGHFEYLVYIQKQNEDKILWKRLIKAPDVIEYELKDGDVILM